MMNKWDFIPVDELGGEEALEASVFWRTAYGKGKVEIVGEEYVRANVHKARMRQQSLRDASLDRIIIKDDRPGAADRVAMGGGLETGDDVSVPIFVS
jgi:hypothetical protein